MAIYRGTGGDTKRPEITILVGDHCDTIYGIHGIAKSLVDRDEPARIEHALGKWRCI